MSPPQCSPRERALCRLSAGSLAREAPLVGSEDHEVRRPPSLPCRRGPRCRVIKAPSASLPPCPLLSCRAPAPENGAEKFRLFLKRRTSSSCPSRFGNGAVWILTLAIFSKAAGDWNDSPTGTGLGDRTGSPTRGLLRFSGHFRATRGPSRPARSLQPAGSGHSPSSLLTE